MTTKITVLAYNQVDMKLAKKNDMTVSQVGDKTLLQTFAVVDLGADTTVQTNHSGDIWE